MIYSRGAKEGGFMNYYNEINDLLVKYEVYKKV